MRLLEDNLAEKMLNGDIAEGTSAIMDVNAEGEIIVMTGDGQELSTTAYTGSSGMG
jgi:ATP-dependent Clp protease ATP-binding subunit ClpC